MSAIELNHVKFFYHDHGRNEQVLENINVTIREGEFVCILGRSGCGKSTLLKLIAGLQLPQCGEIRMNGTPVLGPDTDRAVVFQNDTLFPWMTARKNVWFGIQQARKEMSKTDAQRLAAKYLDLVGMAESADKYPFQLSGGMQQRVAIARALAMDTDILLLDEPFGALDARNRRELQQLLERLWSGAQKRKTVIFVTHDIAEAALLADRILYMTPGQIAADICVDLPRPRGEQGEQLKTLKRQLLELFYGDGEMEIDDETGV